MHQSALRAVGLRCWLSRGVNRAMALGAVVAVLAVSVAIVALRRQAAARDLREEQELLRFVAGTYRVPPNAVSEVDRCDGNWVRVELDRESHVQVCFSQSHVVWLLCFRFEGEVERSRWKASADRSDRNRKRLAAAVPGLVAHGLGLPVDEVRSTVALRAAGLGWDAFVLLTPQHRFFARGYHVLLDPQGRLAQLDAVH